MNLKYSALTDGSVLARFKSNVHLQGYDGIMHGGVISALLDSAMTNCLHYHSIEAVTGELNVRFFNSVPCNASLNIRASIEKNMNPLYLLKAEIRCENKLMASANAKFMKK
ncbi:MAG: PaaI family thioesterase [Candidatus Rifleibacteriota bacterium]